MEGMKAVAALKLANGHTLEFYDYGNGALVSEAGEAGTEFQFNQPGGLRVNQLVNLWETASPSTPAPSALRKMQDRLMLEEAQHPTPVGRTPKPLLTQETPFDDAPTGIPDGTLAAPIGCNNKCCDYEWLKKQLACASQADYNWFYYNAGTSYGKGDDAFHFDSLGCAAVGDSIYRVHIQFGGGKGEWTLPQGIARTAHAAGGVFDDPNVGSYMNWGKTPKLHSHCGVIWF